MGNRVKYKTYLLCWNKRNQVKLGCFNFKPILNGKARFRRNKKQLQWLLGTHVNPTCMIPFLTEATGVLSSWFCGNAQFDLIGQLHLCAIYKTHHRRSGAETVWGRRAAPRSAQTYPRWEREGGKSTPVTEEAKAKCNKEDCVFLCIAVSIIILLHSTDINSVLCRILRQPNIIEL